MPDRPGPREDQPGTGDGFVMRMAVVNIVRTVNVRVAVRQRLVGMLVFVPLGQVQSNADGHQQCGNHQLQGDRLSGAGSRLSLQ